MSFGHLPRLAFVTVAVDAIAFAIALIVCAFLGEFQRAGIGTALFVAGIVLVILGPASTTGGAFRGLPLRMHGRADISARLHHGLENEAFDLTTPGYIQREIELAQPTSWTLAISFAGISLLVFAGILLVVSVTQFDRLSPFLYFQF